MFYIFCACITYIQHTDDKNDCYFPILVSTKNRMLPLTFNYRACVSMESRLGYTLQQPTDQYFPKEFLNESSTLISRLRVYNSLIISVKGSTFYNFIMIFKCKN